MTEERVSRCQCGGQCGHNHQWLPTQDAVPCRAPHGCWIHRKRDNPSRWVLSERQGVDDKGNVIRSGTLAHREFYNTDKPPIQVLLTPLEADGEQLWLCQRCKLLIERQVSP